MVPVMEEGGLPDSRLGEVQTIRGDGKRSCLCHGDKCLDAVDVHHDAFRVIIKLIINMNLSYVYVGFASRGNLLGFGISA